MNRRTIFILIKSCLYLVIVVIQSDNYLDYQGIIINKVRGILMNCGCYDITQNLILITIEDKYNSLKEGFAV